MVDLALRAALFHKRRLCGAPAQPPLPFEFEAGPGQGAPAGAAQMRWTVRNAQRLGVIGGQPAAEETPDLSFEGGRGLAHFSVIFPAGEGGDAGERVVGGRLQAGSHLRPGGRAAAGARSPFTLIKFA